MSYKETPDEAEDVNQAADLELEQMGTLDDKELDYDDPTFVDLSELEQLAKKAKTQQSSRFSLKARRAIEDHVEQRRLRKELDYLFDDHFSDDESNKKAS